MPYCPQCGFEYEEGVSRCPDCTAALRPGSPPKPALPGPETRPVRLCTVPDVSAGEILRAILTENGIPSVLQRHGPVTGELGRVTDGLTEDYAIIMVPANRLREAMDILAAIESGSLVWPDGMEPDE
ncbi:MAG: hypothetical protein ABSD48_08870 [Armatimonadota bacterium]